jgi:hypothetical protein
MSEVPKALFRNTEIQHANAFLEEGELLFRPLSHFRTVEGSSRDEYEGQILRNLRDAKIEVQDPETNAWHKIDLQSGNFIAKLTDDRSDRLLIKCFSLARKENSYGNTSIEIFDPAGFLNQLDEALSGYRLNLNFGNVKYYDAVKVDHHKIPIETIWLHKRIDFQPDEEFRLAIFIAREVLPSYTPKSSVKVILGSLSKYARILPLLSAKPTPPANSSPPHSQPSALSPKSHYRS